MAVESKVLRASMRVTNLHDKPIQSYHRFRHDITALQAEYFLEAIGTIRGVPVGNGFLTVTTELVEAA